MSDIFSGNGGASASGQIPIRQACTVLYNTLPPLEAELTQAALEAIVGPCHVEWANIGPLGTPGTSSMALVGGVAEFERHKIAMVALNAQVRPEVLAVTVGVSPMPEEERASLLAHGAAIRLLYIGDDRDPIGQLTALYIVASVLLHQDGLGIINERAALALPAGLATTYLSQLGGEIPPIPLWTGVVTFRASQEQMGREGYLLRTYGMDQSNLPELAMHIADRTLADDAYHILMNIGLYFVQARANPPLGIGARVEFKDHAYLLTDPGYVAPEFASQTGLLLLVEV